MTTLQIVLIVIALWPLVGLAVARFLFGINND